MRGRWMVRAFGAALALWLTTGSASAALDGDDYASDGKGWNGIAYLLQTAAEAEVEVQQIDELKMDRLAPHHVVLWLHPTTDLPTAQLLAFVRNGGRLIIADDVGSAGPLFESIGLRREPGPSEADGAVYARNPNLPILETRPGHFTMFNVEEVVANHPARLYGEGKPVISFSGDGGGHLAIEVPVGQGAVFAISDPSIFISQMLTRFYGNKQFAANVLRVYLDSPRAELLLALPHTTVSGTYGRLGPLPDLFRLSGERLNRLAQKGSAALGSPPWPHLITGLLAFLGLLLVRMVAVRVHPSPPLRGFAEPLPSTSPRDTHRRALISGRSQADFSDPAHSLVTEGLAIGRSSTELPPDCQAAHLRIQGMAASLRGGDKLLRVGEAQFLTLADDVKRLRENMHRRQDDRH